MTPPKTTTEPTLGALAAGLDYLFDRIYVALDRDAEHTGPLSFAFAAGYREAFVIVAELLLADTPSDAYDYTYDSDEFIHALLSCIPPDRPDLAEALHFATGYWMSLVPSDAEGPVPPKSHSLTKGA